MFNDHPEPQTPTALDPKETIYRANGLTDLLRQGLDVWWYDRNWTSRIHDPMPGLAPESWEASVFHDVVAAFRPSLRPLVMSNVDGVVGGIVYQPPHPAYHRYPVAWTGDTMSSWAFLRRAVDNGVDEGALGMLPYVLEDVGGFRGTPSPELYTRFIQYCALSPVLRVHCSLSYNRYPWSFGPQAERAVSEAIRFRYRLIPTLYSAVHRATADGTPLLRRLDFEWPRYEQAASSRQYLLGDDLLVSPVTEPAGSDLIGFVGPFRGEYFTNPDLQGEPKFVQRDERLDFDWNPFYVLGFSPDARFSVRWTGRIGPITTTGAYRFGVTSQDGARLWIDGKKVVDTWGAKEEGTKTGTTQMTLEAGKSYDVRMEYQDLAHYPYAHLLWDGARVQRKGAMRWSLWCPPGTWIDGWTGDRIVGPKTVTVPVDTRRVPTLVRDGAVLFLGDDHVRNADEQLKRPITIETYPGPQTTRQLVENDGISVDAPKTVRQVTAVRTKAAATVKLGASTSERDLVLRIHLRPRKTPKSVTVAGVPTPYRLERPGWPAAGLGGFFAARGGSVVELRLPKRPVLSGCSVVVRTT